MIFSCLNFTPNVFNNIVNNIELENITRGRKGANFVNSLENIPIVRTTTKYKNPVKIMTPEILFILNEIQINFDFLNLNFNNCMLEIYDKNYKKMKYHTDQSLDLHPNSYICIFSCYENENPSRSFYYFNKINCLEKNTVLFQNSIILFSVEENYRHNHKIVYDENLNSNDKWLGITFRFSKTFIKFINEIPYFCHNNKKLTLASIEEEMEFYKMKTIENIGIIFEYPEITYTISESDLFIF